MLVFKLSIVATIKVIYQISISYILNPNSYESTG